MNAYDDMLYLPHPTSERHPRMPIADRAAIFSPFAALTGHADAIAEAARLTEEKVELDEDLKQQLDRKLRILDEVINEQPEITVTWFRPDERKSGGSYVTTTGRLKKIDGIEQVMVLADGKRLPLDDILDIESDLFRETFQDDF